MDHSGDKFTQHGVWRVYGNRATAEVSGLYLEASANGVWGLRQVVDGMTLVVGRSADMRDAIDAVVAAWEAEIGVDFPEKDRTL